jgi:hypothetical protein
MTVPAFYGIHEFYEFSGIFVQNCKALEPNVAVEWLTLLLRFWDVPGSNLGP